MHKLSLLLYENKTLLIEKVLDYARQHSYYKFVTGLKQPWLTSVERLNDLLISSWQEDYPEYLELGLSEEFENCPIHRYINEEARKHRSRGINPAMFLGMLKYYRKSYLDLVASADFNKEYTRLCTYFIARFFDRLEISLSSTWSDNNNELLKELQKTNRELANEKIKYLTIFENLPTPAILIDKSNKIKSINNSFTQTFPNPESVCNWLADELQSFKISQSLITNFEKAFVTKETIKYFEIQIKQMLDLKEEQTDTIIILNDITARMKSQDILKENEELFRSYFENAAVGTALVAIDGQCLRVNKALCDILGYSKEELPATNLKSITHPEDISKTLEFLGDLLSGNSTTCHFEKRYIHKHGHIIWIQQSCSLVMDFENKPGYFVIQTKDITKQKLAEFALKESLQKYITLFNNADDMITLQELREDGMPGRFTEVNDMTCKKLGYTRAKLLGMNAIDLMTEESVILLKNRAHEYLNGGSITCELTFKTKGGTEIPFEFSAHFFLQNGKKVGLTIARDISERKKSEAERERNLQRIKENEALLSAYFDNSSIGMDLVTPDGRFVKVNAALCKIFGYSKPELLTKNVMDIIYPEDYNADLHLLKRLIAGEQDCYSFEKRIITKSGSILWIQVHTAVIRDENDNLLYFANQMQNITEKKLTEEALRTSEEKFRAVFAQANDAIILRELTEEGIPGAVLEINDYACDVIGYNKDQINKLGIPKLLDNSSLDINYQALEEFKINGKVRSEITFKAKDGRLIPAEVVSHVVKVSAAPYVLTIARDISERKKMETLIRENAELYRSYFENSAVGTAFISIAGIYLKVNKALCNILGYSKDELINTSVLNYTHPDDLKESHNFIRTVLNGTDDSFIFEKRYVHKQGQTIWVQITSSLVKDMIGNPLYFAAQTVDITQRKIADIAIKESEEKFKSLFNHTNDMIFLREMTADSLPGKFIEVNNSCSLKLGYTKGEFLEMEVADILTSGSREKFQKVWKAYLSEGCVNIELDYLTKDKTIIPVEVSSLIFKMNEKAVSLAIARDITERKKAETMLRKSEELYRSYFENSAIGMAIVDLDGKYKLVNEAFCELLGYSKEELQQMAIKDITHPEDLPYDLLTIENLFSGKVKNSHLEKRYFHKKGHIIWIQASATLANNDTDVPSHLIVQVRNITDWKMAIEALKVSEERFKTLFDNASDMIVVRVINEDGMPGDIIEVNKTACLKLGYSKEEFFQLTDKELLSEETVQTLILALKQNKSETRFTIEGFRLTKSGKEIPSEISYHLFEFQGQKLLLAIARDLSERKKLEEEYIKSSKLNSLSLLAGGVAHDFKNFLTIILGNISLIKIKQKDDMVLLNRLLEVEKAAQEANNLTKQLLAFAKGGDLNRKMLNVGSLLRETTAFSLSGSVCKYELNVPETLWWIEADQGQLVQVINNLIFNADQAMPKGGTIRVTAENHLIDTESSLLKTSPYIKISIADEGIGIEPENLPRIFEPYFTTKEAGHGLGLATCYSIIKNHGGYIEVQSEVEVGTTFNIYLPSPIENEIAPPKKAASCS